MFLDYTFWYKEAKTSHKEFLSSHGTSFLSYEKAKQNYIRLSKTISHLLSDSLVGYDMFVIIISLCLTTFVSLFSFYICIYFSDFIYFEHFSDFIYF